MFVQGVRYNRSDVDRPMIMMLKMKRLQRSFRIDHVLSPVSSVNVII